MRIAAPVALTLVALLVSGCVPQKPVGMPVPAPTSTPVFASEEEALAAAEVAYAKYLAVSDQIGQEGGANPERMKTLVTADRLQKEIEVFNAFASTGRKQVGSTRFYGTKLQQYEEIGNRAVDLVFYVCTDFSQTGFVDLNGADATSSSRPTVAPFEIAMEARGSKSFVVSGSEPWADDSLC